MKPCGGLHAGCCTPAHHCFRHSTVLLRALEKGESCCFSFAELKSSGIVKGEPLVYNRAMLIITLQDPRLRTPSFQPSFSNPHQPVLCNPALKVCSRINSGVKPNLQPAKAVSGFLLYIALHFLQKQLITLFPLN